MAKQKTEVPKPPSLTGDFTPPENQQNVFVVDPAAQARKQYTEEARYLAAHPIDETHSGGYFIDVDGKSAHDANGNPVPLRDEDKEHASFIAAQAEARRDAQTQSATQPEDSPEELAERQRRANLEAARSARARGEPVTTEEQQ